MTNMNCQDILDRIKDYIEEGVYDSTQVFKGHEDKLLAGKISAYNDVYDYIEQVLEKELSE